MAVPTPVIEAWSEVIEITDESATVKLKLFEPPVEE